MARIRTIKPEFWTSHQVAECSPTARLLFIGMWNFCDDSGIHPGNEVRLKMEVFPADNFSRNEIIAMLNELEKAKLIEVYNVEEQEYWRVTGWKHQKIDKPNYKFPLPDGSTPISGGFADRSTNSRRVVVDHSLAESNGRESSLKESINPQTFDRTKPISDADCGILICRELNLTGIKAARETSAALPIIRTALGLSDNWLAFDFLTAKWRAYRESADPKYLMKYENWLNDGRWQVGEKPRVNGKVAKIEGPYERTQRELREG